MWPVLRVVQVVIVHRLRLTVVCKAELQLLLLWLKYVVVVVQAKAIHTVHLLDSSVVRIVMTVLQERMVTTLQLAVHLIVGLLERVLVVVFFVQVER